jgi:hypothetical protein
MMQLRKILRGLEAPVLLALFKEQLYLITPEHLQPLQTQQKYML